MALTWNAALEPVPQKLELVVQGTMLLPPACEVAQPAGSVPAATPLKFSLKMVVADGVPVKRVWSRVAVPCSAARTVSTSSMKVPGTKLGEICSTKSFLLVAVAPGAMLA